MPPPRKRRRYVPEENLHSESEADDLMSMMEATEDDDSSSSSTCSSSFPSSFSSPSSCHPEIWSTPEDELSTVMTSSQGSQRSESSGGMVCTPGVQSSQDTCQQDEVPGTSQALPCAVPLLSNEIDMKVNELIKYLLYKYVVKEPATKAEMLTRVIGNYHSYYNVIFSQASVCMLLVFGIDMIEVEALTQSFVLVTALDLTYDGFLTDVQGIPKTGLLIMILCIIFMNDNCISEELLWSLLDKIGVYAEVYHFLYGYPRRLVTEDFVQERYLEYRQVPHTDPARYEFLWGPRAHAETSKMKVLQFLTNLNGSDPTSYPALYADALRDEEERAKASISPADDSSATHCASFSALAASSSDKFW